MNKAELQKLLALDEESESRGGVMPDTNPLPNPNQLLADLVEALNKTSWSSWQTTDKFAKPLEAAEEYLNTLKGKA